MEFKDVNGEVIETVAWQWIADYGNGTGIRQFDTNDGSYHYFRDIDQSQTKLFGLFNPETGKNMLIDIPEGAKLIHYYNTIIQHPLDGEAVTHRLFSFGYELGKDKKVFTILPNGFLVEAEADKVGVL